MPPVLQIQWNVEYEFVVLLCQHHGRHPWYVISYIAHFLLAMLPVPIVLIFLMACQLCTPPITYYVYNVYLTLTAYWTTLPHKYNYVHLQPWTYWHCMMQSQVGDQSDLHGQSPLLLTRSLNIVQTIPLPPWLGSNQRLLQQIKRKIVHTFDKQQSGYVIF